MPMKQGEKLDFLMRITGTQNSALGRALSFDASYISRIRSGKRGFPKHRPFIEQASAYFAERIEYPFQETAIAETVCSSRRWPKDSEKAAELLAVWLGDENAAALGGRGMKGSAVKGRGEDRSDIRLFYGNEGKREAVLRFLGALSEEKDPCRFLLCSDEDMSWLYEDADFGKKWAALLHDLLQRGSTIRIIHTIGRDIGDMLEALRKWMPLYLSGGIEPYYCPRLRDGVYRQTRFIAEGHSALVASSVGNVTEGMLNVLTTNADAVRAFELEFEAFLALCRPLMHGFGPQDEKAQREAVRGFIRKKHFVIAMQPDTVLPEDGWQTEELARLQETPGFSGCILSRQLTPDCVLLGSEDGEALVFGTARPGVMFRIQEPTLGESIWEYLQRLK